MNCFKPFESKINRTMHTIVLCVVVAFLDAHLHKPLHRLRFRPKLIESCQCHHRLIEQSSVGCYTEQHVTSVPEPFPTNLFKLFETMSELKTNTIDIIYYQNFV